MIYFVLEFQNSRPSFKSMKVPTLQKHRCITLIKKLCFCSGESIPSQIMAAPVTPARISIDMFLIIMCGNSLVKCRSLGITILLPI